MLIHPFLAAFAVSSALAATIDNANRGRKMQNLVTFGNSFTDEGRAAYMDKNHKLPPKGAMLPASDKTYSGGKAWGRSVADKTKARLYDYAVGGAMCSNSIASRKRPSIDGPYPDVLEYEIPTYQDDVKSRSLYPDRDPSNTVYALWIGTNDLGIDGFLGDGQNKGVTLQSFQDCVWTVFDHIYKSGGRRFVLLNLAPLQLAPMYAEPNRWGTFNTRYIRNPGAYNVTQFQQKLMEYVIATNALFEAGGASHLRIKNRWPGAELSIFDTYSLFQDVYAKPSDYLEAPANVTAAYHVCFDSCRDSKESPASFMWYDDLHPTAKMDEIIAENFINVVHGKSDYLVTV